MHRTIATLALAAALLVPASGGAATVTRELVPGVTYAREVEPVGGRAVVVHTVTAPAPGGLYALEPVLSGGTITGRETVSSMQRALASEATAVGVNGDYFSFLDGHPSGMFMRDGVLAGRATSERSTLGIGTDGVLRIGRIAFFGTWGIGDLPRRRLDQLNRPLESGEVGLFTRGWGASTPSGRKAVDIVVTDLSSAVPNTDLAGLVSSVSTGGGTPIPPGGAVLQATGSAAAGLEALALPGVPFVVELILEPWWAQVQDAIGGGPALVRRGRLALPTTEGFTASQLLPRAPRTAVGQLADGRVVLLVADGRSRASAGLTMRQLARVMLERGVVTAMALDGGGSSVLAFDGQILNRPSDGRERPIGDALMLLYYGVYAPPPPFAVASPNGDGIAERERLSYRLVRPSKVDAQLVGPAGKVAWRDAGEKEPGTYAVPEQELDGLAEGRWRFAVRAVDEGGAASRQDHRFTVNRTLGFLTLSRTVLAVGRRHPASLGIGFELAHAARVSVTVREAGGGIVRTLLEGRRDPGSVRLSWSGRTGRGDMTRPGRYAVVARAVNRLGAVELSRAVTVRRPG